MLGNEVGIDKPPRMRQLRDKHQSHGNGFAVTPGVVFAQLHGGGKSMPVIELLPQAGFFECFTDELGLDRGCTCSEFLQRFSRIQASWRMFFGALYDYMRIERVSIRV